MTAIILFFTIIIIVPPKYKKKNYTGCCKFTHKTHRARPKQMQTKSMNMFVHQLCKWGSFKLTNFDAPLAIQKCTQPSCSNKLSNYSLKLQTFIFNLVPRKTKNTQNMDSMEVGTSLVTHTAQ